MKVVFQIVIFLFFIAAQSVFAMTNQEQNTARFLSMTDIHFNPFESCNDSTPCPLIKMLQQTSSDQWSAILAKYQIKPSSYGTDTNYPSLESALSETSQQAKYNHVNFIVVLGDYLAHDYALNYVKYSGDMSPEGYQAFVKKTQEFMTSEFAKAFPDLNVFMAVGNNDSYVGDYVSEPNGQFYQDMSGLWSGLVKDKNAQTELQKTFPLGGYYAVLLPNQANLRLIVMNSVLFSMKAKGDGVSVAALKELDWLHDQLAEVKAKHQKALIMLHIPAGVDVYATQKAMPVNVVQLWKPEYTTRFHDEIKQYAADISGILSGHFHMDFFQVLDHVIPVSGTPAISPGFGNNPAFKIYSYSLDSLKLVNFTTYFNALNNQLGWMKEYDFNQIYQPACKNCQIIEGMSLLQPTGNLATDYINFYGVSTDSQPISKANKWLPYYWCSINTIVADEYQACINGTK